MSNPLLFNLTNTAALLALVLGASALQVVRPRDSFSCQLAKTQLHEHDLRVIRGELLDSGVDLEQNVSFFCG